MRTVRLLVPDRRQCVVLVPVGSHIEPACEAGLSELERRGYSVWRVRGYAAIDQGRNQMATDALEQGFVETMWIDSDIAFDPDDVDRLRCLELPIACAIYPKKGKRELAAHVLPGTQRIVFGQEGGLVELLYAATGFLHVRREVYESISSRLHLPRCNQSFGKGMVPWFQPMIVGNGEAGIHSMDPEGSAPRFGRDALPSNPVIEITPVFESPTTKVGPPASSWYLAEDYAFCERARRCGYRIWADTRIRLSHVGAYHYSWEEAGTDAHRFATYTFHLPDAAVTSEQAQVNVCRPEIPHATDLQEKAVQPNLLVSPEVSVACRPTPTMTPSSIPAGGRAPMTWEDVPGWFDFGLFYDQAVGRTRPSGVIVEVGTWLGRSTIYLAQQVKAANKGIRVYSVDHCIGSGEDAQALAINAAGGNIASALVNNLVRCGVFDTVVPILTSSERACELFADESLSLVFIDAAHDYSSVRRDISAWWPKVEVGGILAGHDYQPGWPDVVRAVDDHFGSQYGVPGRHLAAIPCANTWSVVKR